MVRHFGLRYIRISLFRHHYQWSPLKLPCKSRVNAPIQPGLFKGTYSAHGIEVLSLDYDEDLTEVTVTKITVSNIIALNVAILPFFNKNFCILICKGTKGFKMDLLQVSLHLYRNQMYQTYQITPPIVQLR